MHIQSQEEVTFLDTLFEVAKEIFSTDFKSEQFQKNYFLVRLEQELGGGIFYIPRGRAGNRPASDVIRKARAAVIKAEFNGRNMRQITKKYNISQQAVYDILKGKGNE